MSLNSITNGLSSGINDTTYSGNKTNTLSDLESVFDYDLQTLILVSSNSNVGSVDLKQYMVELNYFEDIFSDTISGKVVISDAVGLIKNLAIDGTEKLIVEFSDGQESDLISHQFRIYSLTNRSFDIGNMFETYTLNFCSEELILSQKYRVCKSYPKKSISDIIKDILGNSFLNTQKSISIDNTYGLYDIVIPSKKIFESINWLLSFAQTNGNSGADMLFFENNKGYNIKSLQNLYTGDVYGDTYSYDPKNINTSNIDGTDTFENQYFTIMKLDVMNTFDTLKGTSKGTFANRLLTIDPLTRQKYVTDFNYKNYVNNAKTINPEDVTTVNDKGKVEEAGDYTDRFNSNIFDLTTVSQQDGTNQTGNFGVGPLKLMVSNNNQQSQTLIANNPNYVSNDFFVERTTTFREAQISLLNYTRIKIIIPGNSDLYVGLLLNVDIFAMDAQVFDASSTIREQDTYLSGRYLITAIRHIINVNRYITVVELAKESNRITGQG
jgi:hypothetical protein